MTASNQDEFNVSRVPKAHYIIRPCVDPYFLYVALDREMARTILARMDTFERARADGLRRLEFIRGPYDVRWLYEKDVPTSALSRFVANPRLEFVRSPIPTDCGDFAKDAVELIASGGVRWSEWWSFGYPAEYAESWGLPREELERVARMDSPEERSVTSAT